MSKTYHINTFYTHVSVTSHLSLSIIFNIILRWDIILITIFYYFSIIFSLAYIHSLHITLITTAQSLTILSILLNFKTSRDIKMRFCHTLHNKAFTERNPGYLTSQGVSRSITVKSERANTENHRDGLSPPMWAERRSSAKFRPDFSLNYRPSTVTEVTRHNRIPQFQACLENSQ